MSVISFLLEITGKKMTTNQSAYYPRGRCTLQHSNAFPTNFDKTSGASDKIVGTENHSSLITEPESLILEWSNRRILAS